MKILNTVVCAVLGHKWKIDETSTDITAQLVCSRCHREQAAGAGSAYNRRVELRASRTRSRTG